MKTTLQSLFPAIRKRLLVSKKFYTEMMGRVESALVSVSGNEIRMEVMVAVNFYLHGKAGLIGEFSGELSSSSFGLLRPEMDRAIARSARARERARLRKESLREKDAVLSDSDEAGDAASDNPSAESRGTVVMNRRQRRQLEQERRRSVRRSLKEKLRRVFLPSKSSITEKGTHEACIP